MSDHNYELLIELLTKQKLAGVELQESKTSVLGKLGKPDNWSGAGQLSIDESSVWSYGNCQINFGEDEKVVALGFFPNGEVGNERSFSQELLESANSALSFDVFCGMLNELGVSYDAFDDASFKKILVGKTQVSFKMGINLQASRESGKRVQYDQFMLTAIRVGNTITAGIA